MKKNIITTCAALFVAIASYAQQEIFVKCPDCGNTIKISISVEGFAAATHDSILSIEKSGQCKAITQNGTQCSRMVQNGTGYCLQHASKASSANKSTSTKTSTTKFISSTKSPSSASSGGRCRATTKKGTRCSRTANSNGYCWQHGG